MDAAPILVLVFIWGIAGLLAKAGKTAKQQQRQAFRSGRPAVQRPGANAPKQADPQPAPRPQPEEGSFYRPGVIQPTISVTEHDDSIYQGSMSAATGEGYDPCHDEQLAPLTLAENAVPAAEAAEGGLQLNWTGNEIVRGIVMSEILKRK